MIQNSHINNGDDCVSFKPNSTNIIVQNLICNGSHGISVGSLGQYPGEVDIVENIYVYNISMSNASDGARIKVWPGASSALSGDLQGGGGGGAVRNITYDGMIIDNVDYAIEITQCYGQKNLTLCNEVSLPNPIPPLNFLFFPTLPNPTNSSHPTSPSPTSRLETSRAPRVKSTIRSSVTWSALARRSAPISISKTSMLPAPVEPTCTSARTLMASRTRLIARMRGRRGETRRGVLSFFRC